MSESLVALGGLCVGGFANFRWGRLPPCHLVVTDNGLLNSLDLLRRKWDTRWKMGLFQNDYQPLQTSVIGNFVPCDFSGYAGLQSTFGWTVPAMSGFRARTVANELTWTHDGGPISNWVYGYYVVNPAGQLEWAERFCPAPMTLDAMGLSVRVKPLFTLLNELPD